MKPTIRSWISTGTHRRAANKSRGWRHLVYPWCLVILLGPAIGSMRAQEVSSTRVGIANFESSEDPRLLAAAESIHSTLGLTLRLLEHYQVHEIGSWSYDGITTPRAPHLRNLDFIIFGSVQDQSGQIILDLSVYSRAEDRVTGRYRDAVQSIFDLFEASDQAAVALLESLSGDLIRFATLRLRNDGSPGEYTVFVDDVPVGRNANELRVLVGNRSVRVIQQRMFSEYTVYEGRENLSDGGVHTVEFRIPLATPEERGALVEIEERILENWDIPHSEAVVEQLFARAFFLLEDISYSPDLANYRRSFKELRAGYRSEIAETGITAPATPDGSATSAPDEYVERSGENGYRVGDRGPAGGLIFFDRGTASPGWRYLEAAPADLADGERMSWGEAMNAVRSMYFGGFADWRLPTRHELQLMHENLHRREAGGFADDHYWSSSRNLGYGPWFRFFGTGIRNDEYILDYYRGRAVRAF